jgi:hypothetical protein
MLIVGNETGLCHRIGQCQGNVIIPVPECVHLERLK